MFKNKSPHRILVFLPNWLGDILFTTPALLALRTYFPNAWISVIVPKPYQGLLDHQPYLNEVIAIQDRSFFQKIYVLWHLRHQAKLKGPWTLGFLFHTSKTRARLFKLSGVLKLYGYALNEGGDILSKAISTPSKPIHKMKKWLTLLNELGIPTPESPTYAYHFPKKALGVPREKSYVVFHPGSNWPPKRWPTNHYIALGNQLYETYGTQIVLTGVKSDSHMITEIKTKLEAPVIDLCGKTNFVDLSNLFHHAFCVVTGDTGPMHLAAASKARVIALYGPTSAELNGPLNTPHAKVISSKSLDDISSETVFQEIKNWKILHEKNFTD
ncbi:MAG: hypothetical protein A3B70_08270 [Deltaproteobacteria bacterium RIFCSPHIGHO2_02_FULL_40_11]|nr:MAG: hypothetical protein A3B70_08270 [Deltaproteobacteria bacterium RIFCSPHIGHO2_02_FULL_40_11]